MTFKDTLLAELAHVKAVLREDATKVETFLHPIITEVEGIIKADAAGDLELGITAAAAALIAPAATPEAAAAAAGEAALTAVKLVVEKQALAVGKTSVELTAQALQGAAAASVAAPAPAAGSDSVAG